MKQIDRTYPTQSGIKTLYTGSDESFLEKMYLLMDDVTQMEDNFKKFKVKASPMFSLEQMATAPLQV